MYVFPANTELSLVCTVKRLGIRQNDVCNNDSDGKVERLEEEYRPEKKQIQENVRWGIHVKAEVYPIHNSFIFSIHLNVLIIKYWKNSARVCALHSICYASTQKDELLNKNSKVRQDDNRLSFFVKEKEESLLEYSSETKRTLLKWQK